MQHSSVIQVSEYCIIVFRKWSGSSSFPSDIAEVLAC